MLTAKRDSARTDVASWFARQGLYLLTVLAGCLIPQVAGADETRGFVVSWFHTATHAPEGNCPGGGNPGGDALLERTLVQDLGYSKEEARRIATLGSLLSQIEPELANKVKHQIHNRGKIDGKPASIFNYPMSVPDPNIETAQGRFMYGFNLDRDVDPTDFENPETHEQGIDNALFRAIGCFKEFNISLPNRPFYEQVMWDTVVDLMPAWTISVSAEDFSKDGPAKVIFDQAYTNLKRDALGNILADATYVIKPNTRSHNVLQGEIKNGVITIEPSNFFLEGESPILTEVELKQAQLSLELQPDGGLTGYIGGYIDWHEYFYQYSSNGGQIAEVDGTDLPGMYYALKKFADAYPDPLTGQNILISAAFRLEAVPVYLADANGSVTAVSVSHGPAQKADASAGSLRHEGE